MLVCNATTEEELAEFIKCSIPDEMTLEDGTVAKWDREECCYIAQQEDGMVVHIYI